MITQDQFYITPQILESFKNPNGSLRLIPISTTEMVETNPHTQFAYETIADYPFLERYLRENSQFEEHAEIGSIYHSLMYYQYYKEFELTGDSFTYANEALSDHYIKLNDQLKQSTYSPTFGLD